MNLQTRDAKGILGGIRIAGAIRWLPASFLRHDLPMRSYANNFGFIISGDLRPRCAYPFDAFTTTDRSECRRQKYSEQFSQRRLKTVARACSDARASPNGPSAKWRAETSQVIEHACCLKDKSLAIRYVQEHEMLTRNASDCERGNGLNQMTLHWEPHHVLGVYFFRAEDAPYARRVWAMTTRALGAPRLLCQFPMRRYVQEDSCNGGDEHCGTVLQHVVFKDSK
eukprot:CAMPEP_0119374860 /NCGR_PEP_ID=MMETSP1334-20130426/33381_1 /TAXON_ID=127549 /ORGANISM="Calcidiscus leptoporus, Strain RCC1130" /LENGTH=224 /DNA_ID=CAMNT_0007393039 /DNA_START=310 /DNA_END=984 /DNA_ORIENTATION=-